MITYVIDYPNGGMGNSLLAHILYSCHKIELDVDNFFDINNGNAHTISALNTTNLIAKHYSLDNNMKNDSNYICLIELIPDGLYNILRLKMSYSKWYKELPTIDNFSKFFDVTYEKSKQDFLESLTLKYLSIIERSQSQYNTAQVITISSFINNQLDTVQDIVCNTFNWDWDRNRSNTFNTAMIKANNSYITWFKSIQTIYQNCCDFNLVECNLEFWEQAAIIAYYCQEHNIPPLQLPWTDVDCFFDKTNMNFIKSMEKYHGKTIRH